MSRAVAPSHENIIFIQSTIRLIPIAVITVDKKSEVRFNLYFNPFMNSMEIWTFAFFYIFRITLHKIII